MRALDDSTRAEVNSQGVRVITTFLGSTAIARLVANFAVGQHPYMPERFIHPKDVARVVISLVMLQHASEGTEIRMRPSFPPSPDT